MNDPTCGPAPAGRDSHRTSGRDSHRTSGRDSHRTSGRDPLLPAVWSPDATSMDLVLDGDDRRPMVAGADGWWQHTAPLPAGTDYSFARDGGDPVPDPRSAHQPYGVHGPSRTVDPAAYAWTDQDFPGVALPGGVIYELHVGTFTPDGTLDAAIPHLRGLTELGVTMVELMPLAAFPGRHGWGYDGVSLFAVHDAYGGPAALQRFVDAAHGLGLGVCLDVVYNHLGPDGNYLGYFADYVTDRHETPWGSGPDLDGTHAREVRRFFLDNALWWLEEFHVDALRLDAVHAIQDDSDRHLLAELADEVHALGRRLGLPRTLVAESDLNDDRMVTPVADGGLGMDAQWADDVHHAVHAWVTGERHGYYVDFGPGEVLAKALTGPFVHDGGFSTFRDRPWGRPVGPEVDGHRFVVFGQNHDQVGNRATGDRPSASVPDGLLAATAALVLLSPFTPMLFMGEEWGARTPFQFFTDHVDEALGRAVTEGRRAEFGRHGWEEIDGSSVEVPDPQDHATRDASVLDRSETEEERGERILALYRSLIELRGREPDLASGDRSATSVQLDDGAGWLRMTRGGFDVVVSRSAGTVEVPLGGDGADEVAERDARVPRLRIGWSDARPTIVGHAVRLSGPGVAVVQR